MSVFDKMDDIRASIIVLKDNSAQEYPVKNAWDVRNGLATLMIGDILNIKSLGRLKVIQFKFDDTSFDVVEVGIVVKWVSDWWDTQTTALVLDTLSNDEIIKALRTREILKRSFHETWGWDEEYVE